MADLLNNPVDNEFIANEIEDQFASHLDLTKFVTVNNELTINKGMKYLVRRYHATDGTEIVGIGEGNSKNIVSTYDDVEYRILCAQNRSPMYDEEEMMDPIIAVTNAKHMGTDMFNTEMGMIYGEMAKAEKVVPTAKFDFNAFADAMGMFPEESEVTPEVNAFCNKADSTDIKKELKDDLKYIEDFARKGYVGTVAGVHIWERKGCPKGTICVNTKNAVTLYNKKGTEVEDKRDANTRKTEKFSRKYFVPALTDANYAVVIKKGFTAAKTTDVELVSSKTYYIEDANSNGFVEVTEPKLADIGTYYEITKA